MKIIHEGKPVRLEGAETFSTYAWTEFVEYEPEQREAMERIVREGILVDDDGKPFDELTSRLLRSRLLDEPRHYPRSLGDSSRSKESASARWLVPGLWRWGTLPMLGGNPKAGKSTLVADLCAALTVPGRRFLDHFDPADVETGETRYGEPTTMYVVVVNAENPTDAFEEELLAAGCVEDWHALSIFHLEKMGSPETFDVTDPENYEAWLHLLTDCHDCDGTDFYTPTVLLVDGLTAILGGDTDRYGEWYAAFRRLMREVGIPNALVTAHATLAGEHLMGGTEAQAGPDGLWRYSSANADDPGAQRYFSVVPRMGGAKVPKTRVHRGEDGRLRLGSAPTPPSARSTVSVPVPAVPAVSPAPQDEAEDLITGRLRAAGATGARRTEVTGRGSEGQRLRPVLDRMIADGLVVVEEEQAGRRTAYRCWLDEFVPHLVVDLRGT